MHLLGIQIGTVNQAGPFDDTHSVGVFNLPESYTHTNQPIYAALRQAQWLNVGQRDLSPVTTDGLPQKTIVASLDLATGWHTQKRKCTQCPTAHAMPKLTIDEA